MKNFFYKNKYQDKRGMTVVETVVAIAIFSILATVAYTIFISTDNLTKRADQKSTALWLAEEGIEAVRSIRDNNFANLTGGNFGLVISDNKWIFSGTEDNTNDYLRSVILTPIDNDNVIATSTVSWTYKNVTNSVSLSTILSNWHKTVIAVGDWGNATTSFFNLANNDDALKVQILGDYAYYFRGSGSQKLSIVNISDPYSLSANYFNPNGVPKNIFILNDYVYITNSDNAEELQIVDISSPTSPTLAGVYNAAGNANGLGIYVFDTIACLTRAGGADKEFMVLNISNPGSVSVLGTLDLIGSPNELVVSGNYAYLASTNDTQELQVVDITNPNSPSLIGSLDIPSSTADALTISKIGNYVLLGYGTNLSVINVSTPNNPILIGTVNLGGTVNDIGLELAGNYVFVATSFIGGEFKIVDISNPSSPVVLLGGVINLTPDNILNGVAYSNTLDLVVGAGSENSNEVIIFIPQ